jgi:hypothetical protein
MTVPRKPHWVDCLFEKHECWGYDDPVTLEVEHQGRKLRILLPEWLRAVHVKVVAEAPSLLFLLGRQELKFDDRWMGVFLIARQQAGDTFEVGVWHELYPYALTYFGLPEED